MATTRVGDIKLLNQRRWEQHLAAQNLKKQLGSLARPADAQSTAAAAPSAGAAVLAAAPWGATAPAHAVMPTAGSLFNRPNPIAYDHENGGREYYTNPYNRKLDRFLKRRGEKRAIRPDGTYVMDYDEADDEQDDGAHFDIFIGLPEAKRNGLFSLLETKRIDASPPAFVPADVVSFIRWRVDMNASWKTWRN